MVKAGICSITFRNLTCEQLIEKVKEAKLDAIEWGSDVHVLPNNLDRAKEVAKLTSDAGLEVSSYGSYYRVGIENEHSFENILKTAKILGAKEIRVWAGRKGSLDADEQYVNSVVADSQRIADLASMVDINISFEYHGKTLTDTVASALNLLKTVNRDNVNIYWQPAVGLAVESRLENIEAIAKYISNVHVFNWHNIERLPLAEGSEDWIKYIETINKYANQKVLRYYLLEFVKDDSIEQFFADAKVLNNILKINN